jgi:hypothetical protein
MALHGHAKIELTNAKTGEVQIIEEDNMITNGLANLFSQIPYMYAISSVQDQNLLNNFLPLNNKAMGGLLLFQNPLNESIDNITIPKNSDNPIIGYASNNVNNGSDIKRGSRNLTESIKLDNGYKFVWDFSTSQGNGQISALSLTHADTGLNPISMNIVDTAHGILTSQDSNIYTYVQYICDFDWNSNIATCIETIDSTHLRITKLKIVIGDTISINDKIGSIFVISQTTKELSTALAKITYLHWSPSDDDYYYGMAGDSYNSGGTMYFYRISKSDYTLDTNFTFTWRTNVSYVYGYNSKLTHKNILYIGSKDRQILKINLSTKNVVSINGLGYTIVNDNKRDILHAGNIFILENGNIVSRNNTVNFFNTGTNGDNEQAIFIDSTKRKVLCIKTSYSYGNAYIYFNIGILKDYLATINNLDTPITKTSDQSMKITYTITEVEDK